MTLEVTDIATRLSVATGPGNSTVSSPATSLGGFMSTTPLASATLNNLFDHVTGAENAASDVEYRCLFALNNHPTDPWRLVRVWLSEAVAGGANAAIGIDPAGIVLANAATAQAAAIVNESTAPAGVTFSAPTTEATAIVVGDVPAGHCFAVWIRRTATNSGALANDGATIRFRGLA